MNRRERGAAIGAPRSRAFAGLDVGRQPAVLPETDFNSIAPGGSPLAGAIPRVL